MVPSNFFLICQRPFSQWHWRLLCAIPILNHLTLSGGSGEIRTHGAISDPAVFKTAAINHSTTLPGAPGRNRTRDLRFTKPLLYRLSYKGNMLRILHEEFVLSSGRHGKIRTLIARVWSPAALPISRRTLLHLLHRSEIYQRCVLTSWQVYHIPCWIVGELELSDQPVDLVC